MILVDDLVDRGAHWGESCHLASDLSYHELVDFVLDVGIPVHWLHARKHAPHFDLNKKWRDIAIQNGAIPVTSPELVRRCLHVQLPHDVTCNF
jgi:hypothetical protein